MLNTKIESIARNLKEIIAVGLAMQGASKWDYETLFDQEKSLTAAIQIQIRDLRSCVRKWEPKDQVLAVLMVSAAEGYLTHLNTSGSMLNTSGMGSEIANEMANGVSINE